MTYEYDLLTNLQAGEFLSIPFSIITERARSGWRVCAVNWDGGNMIAVMLERASPAAAHSREGR